MELEMRVSDIQHTTTNQALVLTASNKEMVGEFLKCCRLPATTESEDLAFRYLAARKFNVDGAVDLHTAHLAFLKAEGITSINPLEEETRRELLSGKFTILNDSDPAGARVAQFFVRLHRPTRSSHRAVLQSIMFQLNAMLRKETAVRNGVILIYDMTDAKYSNFDVDLSKKIFKMLKSCYPVRLRRIIILTAPLWFRAPFQILRVFIREELRDRVHVVRPSPGSRLASLSNPDPLLAQREHYAWLTTALTETGWLVPESEEARKSGSSSSPQHKQTTSSAYFDKARPSSRSGRSSSSVSDLSETGEDDEQSLQMACLGTEMGAEDDGFSLLSSAESSCSWDPFGLSSSQSSEAETGSTLGTEGEGDSRVDHPTARLKAATCTTAIDSDRPAADSKSKLEDEGSADAAWRLKQSIPRLQLVSADMDIANIDPPNNRAFIGGRDYDSAGTPTPPAVPRFVTLASVSKADKCCARPSSVTERVSNTLATSESLLVSTDLATPTSDTVTAYPGKPPQVGSDGCGARSSPSTYSSVASSTVSFSSACSSGGLPSTVRSSPEATPVASRPLKQAPLAYQDDFEDQTIRKEKRSKQNSTKPIDIPPSDALPLWSLNRPTGSPIHTGPDEIAPDLKPGCVSQTYPRMGGSVATKLSPTTGSRRSPPERSPLLACRTQTPAIRSKTGASSSDEDSTSGQQEPEDESNADVQDVDFTSQWLDPQGLVNHVVSKGLTGLSDEYATICRIKPKDPCTAFRRSYNSNKNRYVDVSCLEKTRVLLKAPVTLSTASKADKVEKSTLIYIHANWVDSYRQKNAFICTQGPLQETAADFWCMTWTYNVPVIVMITRCYESQRSKCYQYWPASVGQTLRFTISPSNGSMHSTAAKKPSHWLARRSVSEVSNSGRLIFDITNLQSTINEDYTQARLEIKDIKSGRTRLVEHFAFHSWPDHGVPTDTTALLGLLSTVQTTYATFIGERLNYTTAWDQPIPPPPIVVHCSAGIGRTGTFIALDVCTKQLLELARVNVPLTVSRIRSQRFGSVQVSAQYVFVYRAILDFAVSKGLLTDSECEKAKMQLSPRPPPSSAEGIFENLDARLLSVFAADPAQLESLVNLLQSRSADDRQKLSTDRAPGTTDSDYEEDDENDELDGDSEDIDESDEDGDDCGGDDAGDDDDDQIEDTNGTDQEQRTKMGAKSAKLTPKSEEGKIFSPDSRRPLPCIDTNPFNVSHGHLPLSAKEASCDTKARELTRGLPPLLVPKLTEVIQSPHADHTGDSSLPSEVKRPLPALQRTPEPMKGSKAVKDPLTYRSLVCTPDEEIESTSL
ncbi:Tyrosine-protein phosphatase non-receptor type 9 [Sparganum proliferum]